MSYRLISFDGVTLPIGKPATPVGTAPSAGEVVRLPNGHFYDGRGERAAPELPYTILYRALASVDNGDMGAVDSGLLRPLRARRGKTSWLVREMPDGAAHWCEARLLQVGGTREAKHIVHQDVELVFEVLTLWRGQPHNTVFYLTDPTTTITVLNAGTGIATEVKLTVTPAATLTALRVAGESGIDFSYTGSVVAGKKLVIDGTTWSVKNDGVGDWDHLLFNAGHSIDDLFRFPANSETLIDVTRTGGSAGDTLKLEWYDCWE